MISKLQWTALHVHFGHLWLTQRCFSWIIFSGLCMSMCAFSSSLTWSNFERFEFREKCISTPVFFLLGFKMHVLHEQCPQSWWGVGTWWFFWGPFHDKKNFGMMQVFASTWLANLSPLCCICSLKLGWCGNASRTGTSPAFSGKWFQWQSRKSAACVWKSVALGKSRINMSGNTGLDGAK